VLNMRIAKIMAKKNKTAKKKTNSSRSEKEFLLTLIKLSERAISSKNGGLDDFFVQQTARLKKELKDIRKN